MCRVMKTGSTSFRESFSRMEGVVLDGNKAFGAHYSMDQIREDVSEEIYQNYFKFALVRNPWDRVASYYVWACKGGKSIQSLEPYDKFIESIKPSFYNFVKGFESYKPSLIFSIKSFLKKSLKIEFDASYMNPDFKGFLLPQIDFIKGVDFIGKLEDVGNVYSYISKKLELPFVPLKQYNRTFKPFYREFYNDETRDIIAKHYAKDIKAFEYTF